MVLEEATGGRNSGFNNDSFTDAPPSNDNDAYAAASSSTTQTRSVNGNKYHIDTTNLPKPFFLFNLSADNDKAMYRTIAENCAHAQNALQRSLRQDEVDAIGYHFAKSLRIVSYGMPSGAFVGTVYAYRGMKDFSFPFWKPKEGGRFNPEVFGPLKGSTARMMWHGLRFNIYGFFGAIAGTLFFSTYATTVNAVGTATDPRLHDYIEAVRKRGQQQAGQTVQRPVGQRNPIESQEGMMDRQAQGAARRVGAETSYSRADVQRPARAYSNSSNSNNDDASPTGGAFERDYEQGGSPADSGLLSDEQTVQRYRRQEAEASVRSAENEERANMRRPSSDPSGLDYDDASPAAGRSASSPLTERSNQSGSSAWDRIRKDASSSGPKQSARASAWPSPQSNEQAQAIQREQREGATLGDSFAFSTTDEERQLAKSEAQRDFDARVEKERHGGDFESDGRGTTGSTTAGASAWERLRK